MDDNSQVDRQGRKSRKRNPQKNNEVIGREVRTASAKSMRKKDEKREGLPFSGIHMNCNNSFTDDLACIALDHHGESYDMRPPALHSTSSIPWFVFNAPLFHARSVTASTPELGKGHFRTYSNQYGKSKPEPSWLTLGSSPFSGTCISRSLDSDPPLTVRPHDPLSVNIGTT